MRGAAPGIAVAPYPAHEPRAHVAGAAGPRRARSLCALVVAACGSPRLACGGSTDSPHRRGVGLSARRDDGPSTTGSVDDGHDVPTGTSTNAGGSFAAYQSCLTSHGVTLPQAAASSAAAPAARAPGRRGRDRPPGRRRPEQPRPLRPALSAADQKALTACASLRPTRRVRWRRRRGWGRRLQLESEVRRLPQGARRLGRRERLAARFAGRSEPAAPSPPAAACFRRVRGGRLRRRRRLRRCRSRAGVGANSATFAKYQACLKSHGIQPGAAAPHPPLEARPRRSPPAAASSRAAPSGRARPAARRRPASPTAAPASAPALAVGVGERDAAEQAPAPRPTPARLRPPARPVVAP